MIKAEDIYRATNNGLDIITALYPQARAAMDTQKKMFALRDEKTPSAHLKQNKNGVWTVTDFGGDGHSKSPIDIYMDYHRMDRSQFKAAIMQLASQYGVGETLNAATNKALIETRPATSDELDGWKYIDFKDKFTDEELRVLGPTVRQEHCEALHWHSVSAIRDVKNRQARVKTSNERYPIFARQCDHDGKTFYKIYEPLTPDKGWRFTYWPSQAQVENGLCPKECCAKPRKYINGLAELKKAYAAANADDEKQEQRLPAVFICSGERDSLCLRSLGYMPVWFNSETYNVESDEYGELCKYAEKVYNIPDIDTTGVRRGTELALKYMDIHTVWLPSWLSTYKDNRGKPRKDFRDWMAFGKGRKDLDLLCNTAYPARFWTAHWNGKKNTEEVTIDAVCLFYFLKFHGYTSLKDENLKEAQFIHITGNVVERVSARDIRGFVRMWCETNAVPRSVLNVVLATPKLGQAMLEAMPQVELDFTSATDKSQKFYFEGETITVTADGFATDEAGDGNTYVWRENVIPHKPPTMEMLRPKDKDKDKGKDGGKGKTEATPPRSKFARYLINTSRLFWREEMELPFPTVEERQAYAKGHQFCIDGGGHLTADQVEEQRQNLRNKMFVVGYMLHHHKSDSHAWAPLAMDNKIGNDDECNGRSGKSFFFKVLSMFQRSVKLSGRNPRLMDNPHVLDQVTRHTQMLLVDDCSKYLNMELFYDNITSDMTVNPKNNPSYTIPFAQSPKLAFTTNYVPTDFSPSTAARLIYMVFSDYYHQQTETTDYLESRSIRDDFGGDLYTEHYSEDDWQADIAFLMRCCQYYLKASADGTKILPPMQNIVKRKQLAVMGENFREWADAYFAPESGRLDKYLVKEEVYEDFKRYSGLKGITTRSITDKLENYIAYYCDRIQCVNPPGVKYVSKQGRIIMKPCYMLDDEICATEPYRSAKTSKELIYIQTFDGLRRRQASQQQAAIDYKDGAPF